MRRYSCHWFRLLACGVILWLITAITHAQLPSVLIIGGGPADLAAAQTLRLHSSGLEITVITGLSLGQLESTSTIENWPGQPPQSGGELHHKLLQKARKMDILLIEDEIIGVDFSGNIKTAYGHFNHYFGTHVIIATGSQPIIPTQLASRLGNGVYTCTTCDGPRFVGKDVLVIGSGSSAIEKKH